MEYEWGTDCTDPDLNSEYVSEHDDYGMSQSIRRTYPEVYWTFYWMNYIEEHRN